METGDRTHLLEELGDVLLQVAFHARVAEEHPEEPFSIDEVAAALVAKLVRRHPHVFADGEAVTATEVEHRWDAIKAQEKPERESLLDGVPTSLSTLARAEKLLSRARKRGAQDQLDAALAVDDDGAAVLRLVAELAGRGVSADAALRATLRVFSS
jgi:XTP/dITP diphosphohydrolase